MFRQTMSIVLMAAILSLGLPGSPAQAAMLDTEAALQPDQRADREALRNFLQREDVRTQMQTLGVNADEALARVDSLSDAEIAQINGKLDQLPAGGDTLGGLISALIFVFVVLLITDILGLTHVFPFVTHKR